VKKEHPAPYIFAIETSCDETAAAITDGNGNLIADVVASQIDFHARFGGVVPEIAGRKHIEAICGVCEECLRIAAINLGIEKLSWSDMDGIAVTYAPGLLGALVVGLAFAKGAAWGSNKPLIGVNHLEGHLYANKLADKEFEPPAVVSLVSGGNTMLVHMKDWGLYEILGSTIDDAVGEAFDKVAKALGLGYPGGPVISKYAQDGNPDAIAFPRALIHSGDYRFSLSGLKTAVVVYINKQRQAIKDGQIESLDVADICASFEKAVIDVQIAKAASALDQTGAKAFCLGGGVAANKALRNAYERMCKEKKVRLLMPPLKACGDNAGMIALVALDRYKQKKFFSFDCDALAHTDLEMPY
ncbi:MAG: tRNA (adenosine(37)-N6)-threonylcarbamoyltransferase complex transferase subunit TsaD, partial [Eggerthellaceae bacterium]|nr:tRNA (adenosine(37)-N6)-threonylcarbamoyltransferase complex transferase subunit TsaD [Eggerthellaceae bacterium]